MMLLLRSPFMSSHVPGSKDNKHTNLFSLHAWRQVLIACSKRRKVWRMSMSTKVDKMGGAC